MPVLLEVVPIGGADFVSQHCPGRVRVARRAGFSFALVPGTNAKLEPPESLLRYWTLHWCLAPKQS